MKCYAVIDTNVLVSALLAKHENSATVKVVNHLFDGTVIPVFSELILAEYGDVLRRKKIWIYSGTCRHIFNRTA